MMLPAKPGSAIALSCSTTGTAAAGAAAGAAASIAEADAAEASEISAITIKAAEPEAAARTVAPVHLREARVGRHDVLPVLSRNARIDPHRHAGLLRRVRTDGAGSVVRRARHAPVGCRDGTKHVAAACATKVAWQKGAADRRRRCGRRRERGGDRIAPRVDVEVGAPTRGAQHFGVDAPLRV